LRRPQGNEARSVLIATDDWDSPGFVDLQAPARWHRGCAARAEFCIHFL